MNDDEMMGFAKGLSRAIMAWAPSDAALEMLLEPENYFDGTQDAVCLTQQLIAEATSLVGVGDD